MDRSSRPAATAGLAAAALGLALSITAPATAAAPARQGCLGQDVSTYARWAGPHGGLVSHLARVERGMGSLVQIHQAGMLPDSVIENSCND